MPPPKTHEDGKDIGKHFDHPLQTTGTHCKFPFHAISHAITSIEVDGESKPYLHRVLRKLLESFYENPADITAKFTPMRRYKIRRYNKHLTDASNQTGTDVHILAILIDMNIIVFHTNKHNKEKVDNPLFVQSYEIHRGADTLTNTNSIYIFYSRNQDMYFGLTPKEKQLNPDIILRDMQNHGTAQEPGAKNHSVSDIKYVAKGGFGCVFRQAVPCTKGEKGVGYVSKLFEDANAANEELRMHRDTIQRIDPTGIFTLKLAKSCKIDTAEIQREEFKKCRFRLANQTTKLTQIIYQDGGIDLTEAAKSVPFELIFGALGSIFTGIKILQKHDICHLDIKPQNMVFSPVTGKLRLIDFGLATKLSDMLKYRQKNAGRYKHQYFVYPPEFTLIWNNNNERGNFPINRNFQHAMSVAYNAGLGVLKQDRNISTAIKTMLTDIENSIKEPCNDTQLFQPEKIDIYSMGISIFLMLITAYKNKQTSFSENGEFYYHVLRLCKEMIRCSPSRRISAREACAYHYLIMQHTRIRIQLTHN
jgi:hypothetical protein